MCNIKFPAAYLALIILPSFVLNYLNSQTQFQRTYNHLGFEDATCIYPKSGGGFLIGGFSGTGQYGPFKTYLIDVDSLGNLNWGKTYGSTISETIQGMTPTSDGNYALIGTTFSFNSQPYGNTYLLKVSPSGNLLWSKIYGGPDYDYGHSIKETSDHGFIITGLSSSFSAGGYDLHAIKTDSAGNAVWAITIGGPSNDEAQKVVETNDGSFMLFGTCSSYSPMMIPYNEFTICKISSGGNFMWMKKYSCGGYNNCYGVQPTNDGGYVLAGWTDGYGQGQNDVLVMKSDSSGNIAWAHTYGGDSLDIAYNIISAPNGDYLVSGYTKSFGSGNYDAYVLRLDSVGNHLWSKTYGGAAQEFASAICNTNDGGFALVGNTKSFGVTGSDIYFLKCDANGNNGCNETGAATVQMNPTPSVTSINPITLLLWNSINVTSTTASGGSSTLLCTTVPSTLDFSHDELIQIFPNPANKIITVKTTDYMLENFEVYNYLGLKMEVDCQSQQNETILDISNLKSGMYFITCDINGKRSVTKFLKQD